MRRGEVWTEAGGDGYAGKPRPVVILQDDQFDSTESFTSCPFTTDAAEVRLFRLAVSPDGLKGLRQESLVDKITTSPKGKLGKRIGCLADRDMLRINRAVMVFLGLAV